MNFSGIDSVLLALSIAGKLSLLVILLQRGLFRIFPIFTTLIFWNALEDPILLLILYGPHHALSAYFQPAYFALLSVDYLLEIAVLFEIGANVLQSVRKSLPKGILLVLGGVMVVVAIVALFVSTHANAANLAHPRTVFVVDSTVAILRLVTFLLIAGFAQVLGLGWKHHVLQLASGFAFYAAVDLIVTSLQNRLHAGPEYAAQYQSLSRFLLAGYLCSMYYWCFTLIRKEAPRKEFSPQMAQLLVSISGDTKRQR
jgi:hypothetical protein